MNLSDVAVFAIGCHVGFVAHMGVQYLKSRTKRGLTNRAEAWTETGGVKLVPPVPAAVTEALEYVQGLNHGASFNLEALVRHVRNGNDDPDLQHKILSALNQQRLVSRLRHPEYFMRN